MIVFLSLQECDINIYCIPIDITLSPMAFLYKYVLKKMKTEPHTEFLIAFKDFVSD